MRTPFFIGICVVAIVLAQGILVAHPVNNLLHNQSLENLTSTGFASWNCTQGSGSDWREVLLKPSADSRSGKSAAALPSPPEGQLLLFRQRVDADLLAHEMTLRLAFWGKSNSPDQLQAVVAFKSMGRERKVRAVHPGDGKWKELEVCFDLPRTTDLATVEFQVIVRPGGELPALVDDIRLWHEEIAPKYALPKHVQP